MTLTEHLRSQGLDYEQALELVERKAKSPHLSGVTLRGKWISLALPDGRRFNEMVAAGRPPNAVSDVEFLKGSGTGKKYIPQLARFPNDPRALVSSRGEVQKLCEESGRSCDGLVKVKEREREEAPQDYTEGVGVSEQCLNSAVRAELAGQTVTKRELTLAKEKIRDKITPNWKKQKGT